MKKLQIFLLILIIVGIGLLVTQNIWVPKLVARIISNEKASRTVDTIPNSAVDTALQDGKYCFGYSKEATTLEPYNISEYIVFGINGDTVLGVKEGTQNGPDMTNGYQGSLKGTRSGNSLELAFSYTIEGSQNTELELYEFKNNSLVKMRYPLIEKDGVLVPDKIGTPKLISYTQEKCI